MLKLKGVLKLKPDRSTKENREYWDFVQKTKEEYGMAKVTLTEYEVATLWYALWYGGTVGERILIGKQVFGDLGPDHIHSKCPVCERMLEEDDDER